MKLLDIGIELALLGLFSSVVFIILKKTWALYLSKRLASRLHAQASAPERERAKHDLEWGMTALATIASNGAFLGLAGTVWHIIGALTNIRGAGADISVISGPIATALYATLYGLASAIPAGVAYNFFSRRIDILLERAEPKTEGAHNA